MVIATKREYYWLKYRLSIVPVICAVIGAVSGFVGREYAAFEKINGFIGCPEIFDVIWKCAVFPLAVIIFTVFVRSARGTVASIMGTKIAMTLIGLVFGINTEIHLPLFRDDWGVLFFIMVDAFIIFTIYNATDAKVCVMSAVTVVTVAMIISHIIMQIEGDPASGYPFRMIYLMMFYYPVWYVVHCTTRRRMHMPTREEWEKICSEEGEE